MSSFFTPRGAPRHPASARALSLSLLLGLSPLAGITPAALATPTQAAPEQQAQATPASPAAALNQRQTDNQQNPVAQGEQTNSLPTLRVTSGTLKIETGGTVHVEGTGFTPEFLAHHELRSLIIAPKGSSTYVGPYQEPTYQGPRFDVPAPAPDGTFSADLDVSSNGIPAGMEYEVILTYRPLDEAHPYQWNTEDRIRTALPVTNDFPASVLPSITYDVDSISEEQINSGKPIEINMTGSGFDGMNKLSFTLVEIDPNNPESYHRYLDFEDLVPADSPYLKRVFHGLIPNGRFQRKITIPAGFLKPGKGYYLSVVGSYPSGVDSSPFGINAIARDFPFIPVGKNPAKMPYQSNTYRNTLPKVSLSPQTLDPYHAGKYKVTISNISPEVDLGYYVKSVDIYSKTARKTIVGITDIPYFDHDIIVVRNPDGTRTVELEIDSAVIKELQNVYLGSEAELRVAFSDSLYQKGSHIFTVTAPVQLAAPPTPINPPASDEVRLRVTSGTLNISEGGTVSVTTAPLSAEFRKKYTLFEFGIVERGKDYEWSSYGSKLPEAQYGKRVATLRNQGKVHENPDGSITFTFDVRKQIFDVPEGTLFDVVLTFYPSDEAEPDLRWESTDRRLTARASLPVVRDPEPVQPTYRYSISAIDKPWQDTTLTVEGYHILDPHAVGGHESVAHLTLYEADPATGKIMGRPVFSDMIPLTSCGQLCGGFHNRYFSTEMTIPAGTLKPGKLYFMGVYGGGLPYPGLEDSPGSMLNDVVEFLPVRSPEQESARPTLHLGSVSLNPYVKTNLFTARATGLSAQGEGSYRLSVQHVDEQGRLTGQTVFQQAIPADLIKDGRAELNLTIAQQLSYSGAYRLVLEKVTPGKDGAGESVEQLAVEDIPLKLTREDELQAAEQWFADRQILPNPSPMSWHSGMTRHDVTVSLYRLAGSPKVELPAFSPYADVATSDPDYAAYIWARQRGITFGWADGKFHPEAKLSTPSTVAFLYRYQKAMGQITPKAPTSSSLPDNSSLPGNQDSPQSSSGGWQHKVRQGSAFWREAQWAVNHRVWGYRVDGEYTYEDFDRSFVSSGDLKLMLYRMEHGGSHLK